MVHDDSFDGNSAQNRMIVEKIAQQVIDVYGAPPRDNPAPPMVKWLVGAIAAFGSASLIGLGFWLVSSVSTMRETLARMDERQVLTSSMLADRFQAIDERLGRLERERGTAR